MKAPLSKQAPTALSPTLRINESVRELLASKETVYHFGFGESRFPVHPGLQEALSLNAHRKDYLPVQDPRPNNMCRPFLPAYPIL